MVRACGMRTWSRHVAREHGQGMWHENMVKAYAARSPRHAAAMLAAQHCGARLQRLYVRIRSICVCVCVCVCVHACMRAHVCVCHNQPACFARLLTAGGAASTRRYCPRKGNGAR
eukprot:362932-Chlamydomonas_euryale.AAC.12